MNTNQTTGYPSIDKPWLKYYPKDADKIEPINLTYYEYYLKANKNYLNSELSEKNELYAQLLDIEDLRQ